MIQDTFVYYLKPFLITEVTLTSNIIVFLTLFANVLQVCCSINNRSVCNKFDNSSRWMPAPIVEYDAFSVRVWYAACADNEHVVGLRYEWRESPCDLFRCAIYSKENGLPAPPMITVGTFGNNKYNRIRARKRVTY